MARTDMEFERPEEAHVPIHGIRHAEPPEDERLGFFTRPADLT
jgi:hypothetical protein